MSLFSRMSKLFILVVTILGCLSFQLKSQVINGKVVDAQSGEPLEYVCVGVVNTSVGIITDNNGKFSINLSGLPTNAVVRVSMISYLPQTFTIGEFVAVANNIKLVSSPAQLQEVVVKPSGKARKVGTTGYSYFSGFCGWGGAQKRQGHEIGTKMELGNLPVQIKSLHVHLEGQAFDSSLFRLHIRSIVEGIPGEELLAKNIIFTITNKSGWFKYDLTKYNLVFKGDVALTLEWVNVAGVNKNRARRIDGKTSDDYILINKKNKQGVIFTRWGTEARWNLYEDGSPSMYMVVQ